MWAPAVLAISRVASVLWESKTWMSSDQETLARQSGRSRCSLGVRLGTEIICWLWYRGGSPEAEDEAGGDGFCVVAVGGLIEAVAEVDDAPVEMGEDRGVGTEDDARGELAVVFESVGERGVS